MPATPSQLEAVLDAAERLLDARENQMVTSEEWEALKRAVDAANSPPPAGT